MENFDSHSLADAIAILLKARQALNLHPLLSDRERYAWSPGYRFLTNAISSLCESYNVIFRNYFRGN